MTALELLKESVELARELLLEQKAQRESSTELLSITRGKLNRMLWAGMAAPDATGAWRETLQVPYASVGFADPYGVGLSIDNGIGDNRIQGPGLLTTSPGDSGVVPISGTQLTVTPLNQAKPFFIALYTRPQPFSYSRGGTNPATSQGPITSINAQSAAQTGLVLDGGLIRLAPLCVITSSGGVSAGGVYFDGSIDGVNWFNIATQNTSAANTTWQLTSASIPARYLRARIVTAITGGTITALLAFGDPGGQG